jgi:acyl-homoserine lactone acylase PvdQ
MASSWLRFAFLLSLVQAVEYAPNATRATAVREAFRHGINGYLQYASGHDTLLPLSNSSKDN